MPPKPRTAEEKENLLQESFGDDYPRKLLSIWQGQAGRLSEEASAEEAAKTFEQSQELHELVGKIDQFCRTHLADISNTQLRNIFELILQKGQDPQALPFIRPRIAYYAAKAEKGEGKDAKRQLELLAYLLDQMIRQVQTFVEAQSLRLFMEAVSAYHRFETERRKDEKAHLSAVRKQKEREAKKQSPPSRKSQRR